MIFLATLMMSCTSQPNNSVPKENGLQSMETYRVATENTAPTIWDSIDAKADWFMDGLELNRNLDLIPTDFHEFYKQFITDSGFQIQRIAFNKLIGVLGECDTTIRFNNKNREFTNWDFTKFFDGMNDDGFEKWDNSYYFSNDRFYYQFRLNEVGWIYKTGFEKINGIWYLSLYYVNAC